MKFVLFAVAIYRQTLDGLGFSSKTIHRVKSRAWPAILLLLLLPLIVSAQIGWQDMGSTTVLKGSAHASGLSNLVNCTGSTPPPYCLNAGVGFNFAGLEQYVEAAQSGAAVDTVHNHMYFTGGGHADYYGNQFYDLNISTKTLTRLTDPSPISGVTYAQYNVDGTGASSHTEQGLIYLPNEDAVFKLGIGVGPAPANQLFVWWITNPRTNPTWVAKAANPIYSPYLVSSGGTGCTNGLQTGSFTNGGGTGGTFSVWVSGGSPTGYAATLAGGSGYSSAPTQGTVSTCTGTTTFSGGAVAGGQVWNGSGDVGAYCMLDTTSASERVLCWNSTVNQLFSYNPSVDTGAGSSPWTTLSSYGSTLIVTGGTCAIHPVLKKMVCAGATYGAGQPSGIYSVDLSSGSTYAATNITSSTSGCSALYSVTNPGFVFDDSTGLFVGYVGTGNSVTLYDYVSQTCVTRTLSGGPTASAYPTPSGTYGRFAYYPKLNQFIVANNAEYDVFSLQLHPNGLGRSTLTCKDIDGDGYGVGPGCLGPDADDSDPTVNTPATVLTKYGNIQTFLEHIGYQNASSLATVYCISTSGSSGTPSTNADTACATPYPSFGSLPTLSVPYILLVRGGTYTPSVAFTLTSGTSAAQGVMVAYPGELPYIDVSGTNIGAALSTVGVAHTTVDGFKIKASPSGAAYDTGTYLPYPSTGPITALWNAVYRCEMFNGGDDSNVDGDNIIQFDIEENVVHDPYASGGQHNIYLGSNSAASSGVAIRRNIAYGVDTGYPNVQFNGRCNYCYIEQNVLYNANTQELALLEGVSNSFIRDNLIFNTGSSGTALRFYNYDSGQCQVTSAPSICPWDQTGNTIANNTIWTGTTDPFTATTYTGVAVNIVNGATSGPCGNGGSPPCGNLGGNKWLNNVIVDLAGTSTVPAVYYTASNPTNYLSLDTWTDNVIQNSTGAPTIVASAGGTAMACSAFNSAALSGSGCQNANPLFVAAQASYYNSPASFNFRLAPGSPAIGAGVSNISIPVLDLIGNLGNGSPALGAYESAPAGTVPSISITFPAGGATVSGSVTLSASASASAGIASIQFELDGSNLGATGNSTPYSIAWSTTSVANGSHTLTAVILDLAGNSVTSAAVSVSVNNVAVSPPIISITSPITGASLQGTVSISAGATPGTLAIASVQFKVDGVKSGPVLSISPYLISLATAGLNNGTHTISATAVDTAGNIGASAGVVVTVNNPTSTSSSSLPPMQGLTGYWNFNEDSGTIAHDSSGNGYNGTITGAPWVTGYIGSALSFNGGSYYVITPAIPQGGAVSISAWVNPTMMTQIGYVRIAETAYNKGFYLGTDSTGTHYKFIVNNSNGSTGSCGESFGCAQGGTLNSGWHLITGTYDGTTATLYVDNSAVAQDTFTAPASESFPLYIGRIFTSAGNGWNGTIDEVRLYNRALTAAEVSTIYGYNLPLVSLTSPPAGATILGTVSVAATATPLGTASIATVQFQVDGSNLGSALTSVPYTVSWNTTTAMIGTHSLTVTATDSLGNTASSSPLIVTVNNAMAANPCDLNNDGVANVLDVQIAINQALGITPCTNASLQANGQCTVVDVQRVVNAALGGACVTGP